MKKTPSELPEFREDLEIVIGAEEGGGFRYLIKDPRSEEIFELAEEECFLCREFNGRSDFVAIQRAFEKRFGLPVELNQLKAFARQMRSLGLMASDDGPFIEECLDSKDPKVYALFDPDRLFARLARSIGWCFTRSFLIAVCLVLAVGAGLVCRYWQDYLTDFSLLRESNFALYIFLLGSFALNPVAELTKGIVCKNYGGSVHAFNLSFAYRIVPIFFCDLSNAMWKMSKSERAWIFSSAIVSQVLLWGVGTIGWMLSDPGAKMNAFWTLFTLAAGIFALLRMVPLLEQDGYYLLSDWLEIIDLQSRAKRFVKFWIFLKPLPEPLSPRETKIFKIYGLAAFVFEFVYWGLLLGLLGFNLIASLKGVGACIFLGILYLRFEKSLTRQKMKTFIIGDMMVDECGGVKLRLLIRLMLYAGFILLMFVPYPYEAGGKFTVLPTYEAGIRPQVPGDIGEVFVKEGEWVQAGQIVGKLSGREQRKKVEQLEAAIQKSQANLELLEKGAKPEEIAVVRQEMKAAETAYSYSKSQANRAEKMFYEKAIPEKDFENALRIRDGDRERLETAKKNLELVTSGSREEQIKAVKAEIRSYEVELEDARRNLEMISMMSPIAGRVITPRLSEKVGQYINVGELFAVVEDARTLIVEIAVPEEYLGEIRIDAPVKLRAWAYPTTVFKGRVQQIAPVAFELSIGKIERAYSEREGMIGQKEILREKGKAVRVLCELDNSAELLKTDMTGYGKIECNWRPVGIAFTEWLTRFLFVEVWSWIP